MWVFGQNGGQQLQVKGQGPQVGIPESILDIGLASACLISVLVRFYLIFSLIGPPTMVVEAQDQHHGGLSRLEDGRNGLTGCNIFKLGGDWKETNLLTALKG